MALELGTHMTPKRIVVIASAIVLVVTNLMIKAPAQAASDAYIWTKTYSSELKRISIDGTGSWVQIGTLGAGVSHTTYGSKIYSCYGSIKSMNLDGTNIQTLRNVNSYMCISDGTYIYYSYENTQALGRMNMDGSSANDSWVTWTNSGIYGQALMIHNGFIYFGGGQNTTQRGIGKVAVSGGSVSSFYSAAYPVSGIATDGTYIYISFYGSTTVGRVNLDGTNGNSSFISGLSYNDSWGVAIWSGKLYVINTAYIMRANLDGTNVETTWLNTSSTGRALFITGIQASATTLSAFSLPTTVIKGISSTITATFSAAGLVTFFANNKRIKGCIRIPTTTSTTYIATCTSKPSIKGNERITASISPISNSNLPATVVLGNRSVVARATTR